MTACRVGYLRTMTIAISSHRHAHLWAIRRRKLTSMATRPWVISDSRHLLRSRTAVLLEPALDRKLRGSKMLGNGWEMPGMLFCRADTKCSGQQKLAYMRQPSAPSHKLSSRDLHLRQGQSSTQLQAPTKQCGHQGDNGLPGRVTQRTVRCTRFPDYSMQCRRDSAMLSDEPA